MTEKNKEGLKLLVVLIAGILVIVAIVAFNWSDKVSATKLVTSSLAVTPLPNATPISHPETNLDVTPYVPVGVPAIHPATASDNANITNITSNNQTFSAKDVEDYVKSHPMEEAVAGLPSPTVIKVEFLTSREVNANLKVRTYLPDDALVCVATLKGSFEVSGPQGTNSKIFNTAYQVFDAKTGNLVLEVVKTY